MRQCISVIDITLFVSQTDRNATELKLVSVSTSGPVPLLNSRRDERPTHRGVTHDEIGSGFEHAGRGPVPSGTEEEEGAPQTSRRGTARQFHRVVRLLLVRNGCGTGLSACVLPRFIRTDGHIALVQYVLGRLRCPPHRRFGRRTLRRQVWA